MTLRRPYLRPIVSSRKGAIQLSMSFLVMLLIAIVIFIFSIRFLVMFFDQSIKLKERLDDQTKSQIENMLSGNARVAIPIDTRTVKRGDPEVFGIGVRNTLPQTKFKVEFITNPKPSFIPISDQTQLCEVDCDTSSKTCSVQSCPAASTGTTPRESIAYQVSQNGNVDISMNKEYTLLISLTPGKRVPPGHYIFNIGVCSHETTTPTSCNGNYYDGSLHKLHLYIK